MARSENGCGKWRLLVLSEKGSGFGKPCGTPHQDFAGLISPPASAGVSIALLMIKTCSVYILVAATLLLFITVESRVLEP